MRILKTTKIIWAGLLLTSAVGVHAAVIQNADFSSLSGWTVSGGPAFSVTSATADGDFYDGTQPSSPPNATPSGTFLQIGSIDAGILHGLSSVSQTITLTKGETISGYYILSGWEADTANNNTEFAGVAVGNSPISLLKLADFGYDPVNGPTMSAWTSWTYTAGASGNVNLGFGVFFPGSDPKYSPIAYFSPISVTPVPEPSTCAAGGLAALATLVWAWRGRQVNARGTV